MLLRENSKKKIPKRVIKMLKVYCFSTATISITRIIIIIIIIIIKVIQHLH